MRSISISALAGLSLFALLALTPLVLNAADTTVNITESAFVASAIDILPGDTVTWVNAGTTSHTMTSDNNSFGSGALAPGARFSQKFTQPGFYPYYESAHGGQGGVGMSGVVRVVQQSATPVQTAPAPAQTTNTALTADTQKLYNQVLQLQLVLAALQAKAAASTLATNVPSTSYSGSGSVACPRIGRILKPGMSGDDVLRLQQFLAADPSIYPDGSATGYYGVLTQAAVQRWQIKNNIVSTGDPETSGFGVVGPRTAAAMSLQCSGTGGTTTGITPTVGGFIQVVPVSGDAPLAVSVQVTVNTVNSCLSATYILDWGDGTNATVIPLSANTCTSVQQTYPHTYNYGGQYVIKLSAGGGHESTAIVVVNGPAKGTTGGTVSPLTITAPPAGINMTAGQTIPISWQSNGTIPAGASIVFDLYSGSGQKVSDDDVIAISSYASGSFAWTIPVPGGVCPAIYPGKLCGLAIPTGSYRIVAKAYQPSTSGNTFGALITEAASGIFTIIAANPGTATGGTLTDTFTASVTSGQAPLIVNFAGKVTSANKGWCENGCFNLLQFGDGQTEFITLPTTVNASLGYTVSHTYQNSGTFLAKLYQSSDTSGPLVGSAISITVGSAPSNFVYGPLDVGPGPGNSPLSVGASFDLPSTCTGYRLTWGDGLADQVQAHSTSCAQTSVIKSLVHTYGQGGSYTVALLRGASLDKHDTVGITIDSDDVANYNPGSGGNSCPVYTVQGCPTGQHAVYGSPSYDANGCSQPNYYCSVD